MVTCRELVTDLFRLGITFAAGLYALVLALFLIARLAAGNSSWLIASLSNFTPYCFMPLMLLFGLSLLARAKWGLILTAPLVLIGLIVLGSYFLPRGAARAEGATLHIATFNVYRYNSQPEPVVEWIKQTDADLVLLQEVPPQHMQPLTDALGGDYQYVDAKTSSTSQLSSLLLSRYPIVSAEDLPQPDSGATPEMRQRYVIDHDGQQMVVYNVDLAIPFGKPRIEFPLLGNWASQLILGYDDKTRDEEIERLLTRFKSETLPLIVAGNFAMSDQCEIYGALSNLMGDSFRESATGFGGSWPVGQAEGVLPDFVPPLLRIDYVWHNRDFRAISARQGGYLGSDHLPLEAVLEILPAS